MKAGWVLLIIFLSYVGMLTGQTGGSIMGRVTEQATKSGIDYVEVYIPNLNRGTNTDETGEYSMADLKPGVYQVIFQRIGFQNQMYTDIVILPNRISFLDVEMKRVILDVEGITVRQNEIFDTEESGSNKITYSSEEIRRAPGSAGDVSRIMMSLPSIAKVNDESNNLIVRGGNPFENTFYIDGIEVPNINHFPHQGGSGGPIGMLDIELINDVSFYAGGFSSIYGDKLSSVMDISFREGNRKKYAGQVEMSFIGFGGVIEGPLPREKGSLIFSLRRSYLDFVVDSFNLGTSIVPKYGSMQSKVVYEINPKHKLTLLGIWADDHNSPDRDTALENQMTHYGNQDLYQGTIGLSWRAVMSNKTFSKTSLSYTGMLFNEDWYEPPTQDLSVRNRSLEQSINLRNFSQTYLTGSYNIEYGFDFKNLAYRYDNYYGETTNFSGEAIPGFALADTLNTMKGGIFLNNNIRILRNANVSLGLRADYFDYNDTFTISPRFSVSYNLSHRSTIRAAVGQYHQNLPLLLLSQTDENRNLKNPRAIHYLAGFDLLIEKNTKLTIELYEKQYKNFPMDITQPAVFVIDDNYFQFYNALNDQGAAMSRGIELVIQKKLLDQIYGLASATYFRSRYRGLDGIWRDRGYDNRFTMSIEGGYKPNHYRDFSIRWIYAGGVPYTPFDPELSTLYNRTVYDSDRINEVRYPDYHSLNIRYDQRLFFDKSSITFFISIWNVYDRKNIANYYWNYEQQKVDAVYQWRILPVFGIEYSF